MPELAEAWDELVGLLAGNVRTALQRGDFSGAESAVAALQRTGHGADLARDLAPQVASARLQEQYLRTIATASDLKLLNYAPPTYPPDALRSQIEGWVELEFILGRDGSPRDVVVVAGGAAGSLRALRSCSGDDVSVRPLRSGRSRVRAAGSAADQVRVEVVYFGRVSAAHAAPRQVRPVSPRSAVQSPISAATY